MSDKDMNELVAMNLRIPRGKRAQIHAAAEAKSQKIVTYVMNAVEVQLDIDSKAGSPSKMSKTDLDAIVEQVYKRLAKWKD